MAIPRLEVKTDTRLPSQTDIDKRGLSIFGSSGEEVARIGDIAGRSWGGSDWVLPEGTWGMWGTRDGVWLKGAVVSFYANFGTLTFESGVLNPNVVNIVRIRFSIDEALPFLDRIIPQGRLVTLLYHFFDASLVVDVGGGQTATAVRFRKAHFRADLDGGGEADYNYLAGPATNDVRTYADVKVRSFWEADFAAFTWNANAIYIFTRDAGIHLLSHEANADPTFAHDALAAYDAGSAPPASGTDPEGAAGGDPGGGSGGDPGGTVGEGPGGDPIA